ncbi:hypothetical protein Tco_1362768 [Tanacetum coccineum]
MCYRYQDIHPPVYQKTHDPVKPGWQSNFLCSLFCQVINLHLQKETSKEPVFISFQGRANEKKDVKKLVVKQEKLNERLIHRTLQNRDEDLNFSSNKELDKEDLIPIPRESKIGKECDFPTSFIPFEGSEMILEEEIDELELFFEMNDKKVESFERKTKEDFETKVEPEKKKELQVFHPDIEILNHFETTSYVGSDYVFYEDFSLVDIIFPVNIQGKVIPAFEDSRFNIVETKKMPTFSIDDHQFSLHK